jgi:hypothetical protein
MAAAVDDPEPDRNEAHGGCDDEDGDADQALPSLSAGGTP